MSDKSNNQVIIPEVYFYEEALVFKLKKFIQKILADSSVVQPNLI